MGFFENLKHKKQAKIMGLTVEEYELYLEAQRMDVSEKDFRDWLKHRSELSLSNYKKFLSVKNCGITIDLFNEYIKDTNHKISLIDCELYYKCRNKGLDSDSYNKYSKHFASQITIDDFIELSRLSVGDLTVEEQVEYYKLYRDKMSPQDFKSYKVAIDLGFDLQSFLEYISLEDNISMQDYISQQKMLESGVSQKDIKAYFAKHTDLTVEEYIDYIPLDHKIVSKKEYKKYLETYSSKFTLNEYAEFCKFVLEFEKAGNNHKDSEQYAIQYMPYRSRLSFSDFLEYIYGYYPDYCFSYLGEKYGIEAYIHFLGEGNANSTDGLSSEQQKKLFKKCFEVIVDFAKEHVRKNSIIKNGVLEKYNSNGIEMLCIPDEAIEIAENAVKIPNKGRKIKKIVFHNKFKKFKENPNIVFEDFGTNTEDFIDSVYACNWKNNLPECMEELVTENIDAYEVIAPNTLKNCAALEGVSVKWFDPNSSGKKSEMEKALTKEKSIDFKTDVNYNSFSVGNPQPKSKATKAKNAIAVEKEPKTETPPKTSSKKSGNKDYAKIISKLKVTFPIYSYVALRKSDIDRINNRIESMCVGEKLILKPEKPVHKYDYDAITEVLDSNGLVLGVCNVPTVELSKIPEILTAEVCEVTPLSQRRKGSKYAVLGIKVNYDLNGNSLYDTLPNQADKFTVEYEVDYKKGSKKFANLDAARRYVEYLMDNSQDGGARIIDENGTVLPGEGGMWC